MNVVSPHADSDRIGENAVRKELPSIAAPAGAFDSYYNTAFTPEEIQDEINILRETDPAAADVREGLYRYRFYRRAEAGQEIISDRFFSFWVELMFHEKTVGRARFRLKIARKSLEKQLYNKDISSVFGGNRPDARVLYEGLYNAARRYFFTCQTDRTYSSHIFGFVEIKRPQLIEKINADFFDAICFSWRCGLLKEYPFVGKAAFHAWSDEFPEMEEMAWRRIERNIGDTSAAEMGLLLSKDE